MTTSILKDATGTKEAMNIDSNQDWIKLIISSAGVSAAINIAWNEWKSHRENKTRRRNAYLKTSINIEDYVQSCIDNINLESEILDYFAYNSFLTEHNGKDIYLFDEPKQIDKPDFKKMVANNVDPELISIEDISEINETANVIEDINKISLKQVNEQEQKLKFQRYNPAEIFEDIFSLKIKNLSSCGIKACNLAMNTRKKSGTGSKSLEVKLLTLKSIIDKYKIEIYK